jgi:hypothetical protein
MRFARCWRCWCCNVFNTPQCRHAHAAPGVRLVAAQQLLSNHMAQHSARRPGHLAAAHHVQVEVVHRLACARDRHSQHRRGERLFHASAGAVRRLLAHARLCGGV